MKKIAKVFILFLLCYIGSSTLIAQPNYRQAVLDTTANFYAIQNDFRNWYDTIDLPDSIKSRALKHFSRWESMFDSRVQSNIPEYHGSFNAYAKALGSYWLNPSCTNPDDANWQNIGPYPAELLDMGLIQSIWVNPDNNNVILVGSGRISGILKSTDFGETWYDVLSPSRIPALGITYISSTSGIDHNHKINIYASTGSLMTGFSVGILKSNDEGETWEIMENFPPYANQEFNYVVEKVVKAPGTTMNPDVIYAITNNKFYSSTDGGISWTWYDFGFDGRLMDLEVDPNNKDVIAVSGDPNDPSERARIWLSTNGGSSFVEILGQIPYQNLSNIQRVQIDFPSSDRLYMLTREPNQTGRVFYYDLSQTPPAWNTSNTINYFAVPFPGLGQFNRAFKVSYDYNTYYIGTECLSIASPTSGGSCIAGYPYYTTENTHCDIRCIHVIHNYIWLGTDGGLTFSPDHGLTWFSLNGTQKTGIVNNEILGFDITEGYDKRIVVGMIDNSFKLYKDNQWHSSTPLSWMRKLYGLWEPQISITGIGDAGSCVFTPESDDWFWAIGGSFPFKIHISDHSFTGYLDLDNVDAIPGHWYSIPLAINNKSPNELFAGGWAGQIIKIIDDGLNFTKSTVPLGVNADVLNIIHAPSDENIMYATTRHSTGTGQVCEKGIYRSDDGGANWVDITGGTCSNGVNNHNYFITSVTVDWNNPNRVWVSMSGVPYDYHTNLPELRNRVYRTDDASANPVIWHDMTEGPNGILPPLPTTAIVNQPGTDRVFLATDGGIFYRGDNDPDWTCFSNGFPITHITDLKIDRVTNEIYASTYGYSIFKADLPCLPYEDPVSYPIDMDIEWSNLTKTINGDITIFPGNTLTINEKSVIHMAPGSSIFVLSGAKLILDDATITSCGGMWQGIELYGDYDISQYDASKGVVELINGAAIQNAIIGISTRTPGSHLNGPIPGTGGIIRAENATFRNCQTAVHLYPFKNSGTHHHSWEKSYFIGCTFVTDDDYLLKGVTAPTHMDIDGIFHLRIQGCAFLNDETPIPGVPFPANNGTGIAAHNSSLVIMPLCTTQTSPCSGYLRNSFTNLYHAINLSYPASQTGNPTWIKEADFTNNYRAVSAILPKGLTIQQCSLLNNYRGIFLIGSQSATVTDNHVEIPQSNATSWLFMPYGLYLYDGIGFTVEGNHFTGNHQANTGIGVLVTNTGAKNNEIYRNTFEGLTVGIMAQFRNKGKTQPNVHVGLCLFCNEFDNSGWDILVGGKWLSWLFKRNIGIHMAQQISNPSDPGNLYLAAGNIFSPGNLLRDPATDDHDFSNKDAEILFYAFPSTGGRMIPYIYSNIIPFVRPFDPAQCLPKSGTTHNLSQGYAALASAQVAYNSSNLILNIWKNGGIENLEQELELVLPWEAYQQYNELMSISPYVAVDALISMIENPSFTNLMVKLVCVANPQASRNDAVLGALYDRNPPMPEQYIEEILDESGNYSPLDELEGNAAADYHLVRTVGNEILRLYYADTVNLWATDSITQFLSRLPGLQDRYAYALHCLRNGDFSTMQTVLDEIPSQFELCERENIEYGFMTEIFSLLEVIQENDLQPGDLSGEQIEPLLLMLETEETVDKSLAIATILWNDPSFEFYEPILEPANYQMRKATTQKSVPKETIVLRLYPNPARDYFTVYYKVPDALRNSLLLHVKDASGRLVLQQPLPENAIEKMIDTGTLNKGVYTVILLNNNSMLKAEKLVIVK